MQSITHFRKIYFIVFILVLLSGCFGVESEEQELNKGTVLYIPLEGGFFGIITDNNEKLDPTNLDRKYQADGKRIKFKYVEIKNAASIHMWGKIVELIFISDL